MAALILNMHVVNTQMWFPLLQPFNNSFFHCHGARSDFPSLSFSSSCCFPIIISTSSPEVAGSLFLCLPLPLLNGFISGSCCSRQMSETPCASSPSFSLFSTSSSPFLLHFFPHVFSPQYISPFFLVFFFKHTEVQNIRSVPLGEFL